MIVSKRPQRYNKSEAYATWLNGHEWGHFVTYTTAYELTQKSARRAMERNFDLLSKFGKSKVFWASEPFDAKEGQHVHALIQTAPNVRVGDIAEVWQIASGNRPKIGTARHAAKMAKRAGEKSKWNRVDIQKYIPSKGAHSYVGKYIMKTGADYDFLY